MANIIDKTYFKKGELKLPIDNYGKTDAEINYYISEHEPIILKKLLGYVLYKEFITGIAVLPTPEQKWIDLREGCKEYEYNGITDEYLGIKQMIADYVFTQIVSDKLTHVTSSGVNKSESENTLPANPKAKQVFALNDINSRQVTLNGFILSSNETDSETYENYLPTLQTRVTKYNF